MSSRRSGGSRAGGSSRKAALEEIRRLRDGGGSNDTGESDERAPPSSLIARYVPQEESVYKNVSEEEYAKIVHERRQGLPFVENDDGEMGYYDDGEEQFFESDPEPDAATGGNDDDDDANAHGSKKRSAGALSSAYMRRAKKMQRAKLGNGSDQKITNMFFLASNGPKTKTNSTAATAPGGARSNAKRDIDLESMLDDLTSNPTESRQTYARPMAYATSGVSSSASSQVRSVPTGSRTASVVRHAIVRKDNDEDEMQDTLLDAMDVDNGVNDDDDSHAFEPDASIDDDDDVHDDDASAAASTDASTTLQQDAAAPTPVATLSKRDLLLRKARAAQLQTSEPTARVLAGDVVVEHPPPAAAAVATTTMMMQSAAALADVPSNEVAEWWNVGSASSTADSNTAADNTESDALDATSAAAAADTIQMYWMDAVEVRDRPGKIYLIGKIKTTSSSNGANNEPPTYKSCCVVVHNLERYMFLVPRVVDDHMAVLKDLDAPAQQQQWLAMHDEIRNVLIPSCITTKRDQDAFQTKLVTRDYAFESANIPRGQNLYLKVKYAAKYPSPPSDLCSNGGKSFSRICGAFTRPLENFLLKRKLLGPGWIEIANVRVSKESASFCHVEYETFAPKHVKPLLQTGGTTLVAPPPLTIMSLSLKTVCHPVSGKHEVVALSAITETGVSADGGRNSGTQHRLSHFTAIRPLDANAGFPPEYIAAVQQDDRFGTKAVDGRFAIHKDRLRIELNERVLLSYFLTRVQLEDPDVIVGHNLHKYALDVLVSRIDNFKLGGLWSKLTRLRRGRLTPMKDGDGWNEHRMDDMVNGRLFCDTYVSSKELLPSQNNYSLSHLVDKLLQKQRIDVEMTDLPAILHGGASNFVRLLRHTLDDAMFVLQLMHKLEVLPLSKQLANLCGYLWPRTLEGNKRAERIEYLLLHEFSRSKHKFIVPEKYKTKTEADRLAGGKRREASYAGGMVFAPKKGLYDNFVVLLDFMSLYPSIIREYNICFTTVERTLMDDSGNAASATATTTSKKKKAKAVPVTLNDDALDDEDVDHEGADDDAMAPNADADIPPLPSSACDEGILPAVIKRLLESRKQVKQQLQIETKAGNTEKANKLDIRQKAIKLTANSMYGCLGFRFSRFYAKPIAALITSTGRQTLQRAKEVAEQECGYDVVYGDTDSIMVDSRTDKLEDAKRIGREIQVQCNKHFRLLELEVDYIFKTILLLNKKKYAALVLKERPNGDAVFEKEVKGLDMVRRDWCVLSKAVGNEILDVILSGSARDDVVERIHEHLERVAERVRSGNEPIEQFVITKSLNKQPEQYPDRAKQYHVQVAIAMRAQGKAIGVGTHIPYVLCKEEEPGSARRAYHPDEVKRSSGKLTIDYEWYLESQIHPPVNRLCAHIEGTSSPQLAHCLGLDTSKFSHAANHFDETDGADTIPSVLQSDADRFKACKPLEVTCSRCKLASPFPGVYGTRTSDNSVFSGLSCPECRADFWGFGNEGINGHVGDDLLAVLSNRLHIATRHATKTYYEGWAVCSDVTCKTRTQKQSLRGNGNICSAPGCRATTTMEFSDAALYTQLKYFESLFDVERAQRKLQDQRSRVAVTDANAIKSELPALSERHRAILTKLYDQAYHAVRRNDYNWVKPAIWQTLFT